MKILAVRLSSLFNLFNCDLHPQRFQLANSPFALRGYVAPLEGVAPKILIRRARLHDVRGNHKNTVAHSDQRFLLTHPFPHALVRRGQVRPLLLARGPGGLHERGPQVATACGRLAAPAVPGRFVVAGTPPGPTGQVVVSGKALQVHADLCDQDLGNGLPDPRPRVPQLPRFRHERVGTVVHLLPDSLFRTLQRRRDVFLLGQQLGQNPPLGLGPPPFQGLRQLRRLALQGTPR